jgi:hypothetical protein
MLIVGKWKPQQLEGDSNDRQFRLISFKLSKHYNESLLYTDTNQRIKKRGTIIKQKTIILLLTD